VAKGQEKRQSAIEKDMLRMTVALLLKFLLLRAKALEFMAKAFEAFDLAY
jgi:hypothetical protein